MLRYLIFLMAFLLAGCANQTAPTGGPKDETPPKLVSSVPRNRATDYKGKIIQLAFDEEIKLNRPYQEILIVPTIGKNIRFRARRNVLIIEPEEEWADSTTYSISIRNGVKDLTEGNTPKNIKIAFSSGPFIDSLFLVGKVRFALQETFPEKKKITVALYASDTFNIFKNIPGYFTETDDKGRFDLENIKAGTYNIYAFEDDNNDLIVQSETETYGFLAKPIMLNKKLDSLTIPITLLDSRKPEIKKIRNNGLYTKVLFNKPIANYTLTYELPSKVVHSFGDSQLEIILYNPQNITDSIQFTLHATDNLDITLDSTFYVKEVTLGKNFIADDFVVKMKEIKVNTASNEFSTIITLSKPIKSFNYDSIHIPLDSTRAVSFNENNLSYDSIHKEITITKDIDSYVKKDSLFIKYKPNLLLGEGFAISLENDTSKAEQKKIPFITPEETGTLLIEVESKEPHYEIQLLSSSGDVVESVHDVKEYSFKGLSVRKYKIRVILDKNNNSKWDAGNIYEKKEPEPVYFYKTLDGSYLFPIRANWELGPFMLNF